MIVQVNCLKGLSNCRSTIFVLRRGVAAATKAHAIAGYQRWFSEARPFVFQNLSYVATIPQDRRWATIPNLQAQFTRLCYTNCGSRVNNGFQT